MRAIQRGIAIMLVMAGLLPMPCGAAELSPERAAFYIARTEEWENALGSYMLWNYYDRAMFCKIYGRRPGDYLNAEGVQEMIPKFPPEDCLTYEEALAIARTFLCDYDPRITEEYLSQLHVGSSYYDYWGDPAETMTRTEHVQAWIIQFGEGTDIHDYVVRCAAYIEADTGRVFCINIGLDMSDANDWAHFQMIEFP